MYLSIRSRGSKSSSSSLSDSVLSVSAALSVTGPLFLPLAFDGPSSDSVVSGVAVPDADEAMLAVSASSVSLCKFHVR